MPSDGGFDAFLWKMTINNGSFVFVCLLSDVFQDFFKMNVKLIELLKCGLLHFRTSTPPSAPCRGSTCGLSRQEIVLGVDFWQVSRLQGPFFYIKDLSKVLRMGTTW